MSLNQLGLGLNFVATDLASPTIRKLQANLLSLDLTLNKVNRSFVAGRAAQVQFSRGTRTAATRTSAATAAATKNTVANRRAAKSANAATAANTGLGKSAGSAAAKYGLLAVGIGGVYLAFKAANAASNFNQQLVATQKIMGATTAELAAMENKILDVGLRTKFSPDEIVEGMKNLGSAGLKASEAMAAIEPAALLATAGQIGLDEASNAIVGTLKAFQLEATEAGTVADKLTRITQLTNLQAKDFATGLSKAAGVAGQFGVSMNETLITLGLLRNMNIDASSASTAMREGIVRLAADERVKNKVLKAGVDIYDKQTGKMRGFHEIMLDLVDASASMTDEQANALSATVFGRRGLLGFGAVAKAQIKVMRNGREVTLKGRDAIAAYAKEMENTAGTAKSFNDALLDTFEGQKQILGGAVETFKVVFGQGFAAVLKPVVRSLAETVGAMAKFFKDLDPTTKKTIALLFQAGAAVALVVGAVVAMGGPIAGVIAGIAAVAFGLKKIFDTNVGGIADSLRNTFSKIALFVKGAGQLITDGFLSGDTLASLQKEENGNVLTVLKTLVQAGFRFKKMLVGIGQGFSEGMAAAAPTFEALKTAFFELGKALGITGRAFTTMSTPSERFVEIGRTIGLAIAKVVEIGARVITWMVRFRTGVVKAGTTLARFFMPVWLALKDAVVEFGTTVMGVFRELGFFENGVGSTGDVLEWLGTQISGLIVVALVPLSIMFTALVKTATKVWKAIGFVIRVFKGLWAAGVVVVSFFKTTVPNAFKSAAAAIKSFFQPVIDMIDKTIGRINSGIESARSFAGTFGLGDDDQPRAIEAGLFGGFPQAPDAGAAAAAGTQRAREAEAAASVNASEMAKQMQLVAERASANPGQAQKVFAQLFIDGEQVAEAVAKGNQSLSASEFGG